jgi:phosphatidate phosphatase APP1
MIRFIAVGVLVASQALADADDVIVYPAFVGADVSVVEGRVIELEDARTPIATERRRDNLRRNLSLFHNDERKGRTVTIELDGQRWNSVTDQEGYFRCELTALGALAPGWHRVQGVLGNARADSGVLVLSDAQLHGVISDLDDTILVSEVNSRRRLLANTLFGNPLQRQAVPGAAKAYAKLAARNPDPTSAPIFYLSASPRQLQREIQTFLDHNGFPRGVLLTKRVTNDATSEPLFDQPTYKTGKIQEILRRAPHVKFTLFGDDGELDPEIYEEIRKQHPEQIEAIWIRRVHPSPNRVRIEGQGDMAQLLAP